MFKKIIFSLIILYFLALIQTSFLVHFRIMGIVPNLVLFLIVIWNFLEKREDYFGLINAFLGGLFLDIFSGRFIGFNILILLFLAIFLKLVFKKYVQISFH